MSCGVGPRCSLDLVLLWLWRRLAATALIGPLAWKPPHAEGAALKRQKRKKKKKKKNFEIRMYLKFYDLIIIGRVSPPMVHKIMVHIPVNRYGSYILLIYIIY